MRARKRDEGVDGVINLARADRIRWSKIDELLRGRAQLLSHRRCGSDDIVSQLGRGCSRIYLRDAKLIAWKSTVILRTSAVVDDF